MEIRGDKPVEIGHLSGEQHVLERDQTREEGHKLGRGLQEMFPGGVRQFLFGRLGSLGLSVIDNLGNTIGILGVIHPTVPVRGVRCPGGGGSRSQRIPPERVPWHPVGAPPDAGDLREFREASSQHIFAVDFTLYRHLLAAAVCDRSRW